MFGLNDTDYRMLLHTIAFVNPVRAVVFGSRARGDNKYNSDIDIAVFDCSFDDLALLGSMLDGLPMLYSIDLVCFNDLTNNALRANILQDGVEIYKRDPIQDKIMDLVKSLSAGGKEQALQLIESLK